MRQKCVCATHAQRRQSWCINYESELTRLRNRSGRGIPGEMKVRMRSSSSSFLCLCSFSRKGCKGRGEHGRSQNRRIFRLRLRVIWTVVRTTARDRAAKRYPEIVEGSGEGACLLVIPDTMCNIWGVSRGGSGGGGIISQDESTPIIIPPSWHFWLLGYPKELPTKWIVSVEAQGIPFPSLCQNVDWGFNFWGALRLVALTELLVVILGGGSYRRLPLGVIHGIRESTAVSRTWRSYIVHSLCPRSHVLLRLLPAGFRSSLQSVIVANGPQGIVCLNQIPYISPVPIGIS